MRKKHIAIGILILVTTGGMLLFLPGEKPDTQNVPARKIVLPEPGDRAEKQITAPGRKSNRDVELPKTRMQPAGENGRAELDHHGPEKEADEEASVERPRYIEEIKKQIYDRQIESVDQIHLLDELVQTGDKDTRQFWGDGWTSVDDWKKEENGFKLEKKDDGTMVFQPDAETARKYTFFENPRDYQYDEANKEFVDEVDYYGKTIYNVAKFINDDVLVMMTISGTKVDLNIYQKNANQQ